jgi:hypothetical protein
MAWQNFISTIDDRPVQVLVDDQFRIQAPIKELSELAWFAVYCNQDPGAAFWDPDETEVLDSVETNLIALCQHFGDGWAVYVCRLATRGIREYFIYHGPEATFRHVLPRLRAAHPEYRLEYDETSDADWTRYKDFLSVVTAK